MLYIDPEHCIDCQACTPECPVEAIYMDIDLPSKWQHWLAINAERSAAIIASGQGPLTEKKESTLRA
jgi:ferredoxin